MFNNLIIELRKNRIKLEDAACVLNISRNTFIQKLRGIKDFKLIECLKLQQIIADGQVSLEYLFKKNRLFACRASYRFNYYKLAFSALSPVLTKKYKNELELLSKHSHYQTKEILFGDENCPNIDETLGICTGTITLDEVKAKSGYVTVLGGGGTGASKENKEYKAKGTYEFRVPYGVDEIEVTLVSGGTGGSAGELGDIKAFSWSHSGIINRSYVGANFIPLANLTSRGVDTTDIYRDGKAVLSSNDLKYAFINKILAIVQAGGGSGGRGYLGTGGGAGEYDFNFISLDNNSNYTINVARGANALSSVIGQPGGASYIKDNSGYKIAATGGGGGAWGINMRDGADAESMGGVAGGLGGRLNFTSCGYYISGSSSRDWLALAGSGKGGKPYGGANADESYCVDNNPKNVYGLPASDLYLYTRGSNGGSSAFGTGDINVCNVNSANRHGKGYGSGGAGGNGLYPYCGNPEYQGSGTPGFAGITYRETGHGGAAGGAGAIVPKQRIKVVPNEVLTVVVGSGGVGGKIDVSGNNLTPTRTNPTNGSPSYIKRGSTLLISSATNNNCDFGGCIGAINGERGKKGLIYKGINNFSSYIISKIDNLPSSKWNIAEAGYRVHFLH